MRQTSLFSIIKRTFLIILLLCGVTLWGQIDKIAFEKYGVAEGLPEEFARNVMQDDQGFIWITTQNGIVKYDGYHFKVYRGESTVGIDGKMKTRGGDVLIKGRDGKIWTSNHGDGIISFDPKKESFRNYLTNSKDPYQLPYKGLVQILFEDSEKNIWFLNSSVILDTLVLAKLDPKSGVIRGFPHTRFYPRYNNIVLNLELLEAAKDSSVWQLLHPGNLNVFNRKSEDFERVISSGSTVPGTDIRDTIRMIVPGNDKYDVLRGDQGVYLWDPVLRKSIKSYTKLEYEDNSLPDNELAYAFIDSKDQLWVLQQKGHVSLINLSNDKIEHFIYGEGKLKFDRGAKKTDQISVIAQNQEGIWFGTTNLSPYSEGEPLTYLYYDFKKREFNHYTETFNDDSNPLQKGKHIFNFKVIQDNSGLLWLATRPNLYKQAPKVRQIETLRHDPQKPESLPSDTITSIYEDSKNRLWIGTSKGLSLMEGDRFIKIAFNPNDKVAKNVHIQTIYEDSKGDLWVGTYGNGLFRFLENTKSLKQFELAPGLEKLDFSYDIECIQEDLSGKLWISAWRRGIYILSKDTRKLVQKFEIANGDEHGMKSNWVDPIYLDSKGAIWVGDPADNAYGLYKYSPDDKKFKHFGNDPSDSLSLISNEIRFIEEDAENRLWIGTDGGLCLFDEEKEIFYRNNDALKMPSVSSLAWAENGKIWVSTYSGGGLALVGPNPEEVVFYGEEQGLLHNDISNSGNRLLMDENDLLWLPNQRGLSIFDTRSLSFQNLGPRDGMQNLAAWSRLLKTRDGIIWIGGQNGLNRIDPQVIFNKDSIPPKMVITAMGVNDTVYTTPDGRLFTNTVSFSNNVVFRHDQRDLSFEFVALHYLRSEDNLYSWKLENYDADWSVPSKERKASYTNLSPGEYTFRVKGSNADGVWNEDGASIHITIAPPWWQTWWAYGIYFVLLLFIGYRVHLYQKARTIKKAQEAAQKKELAQAKEIKKAYADLKATQTQLIQAEKMASLGELTAGIAHEIQNPLNFVNNFSEVNRELIEELKEEKAKNKKERDESLEEELLTDIDQNLEKISHHGKRADSIVKGMLQHSRASSGEKEPTDINVLADEYLRLAYHGLRAKDKSFNATMKTDFDKKIGKINVIPQDMGRVILNLITNAFHAVQERKKSTSAKTSEDDIYEPTVGVSTKKVGDTIEIEVKDNGNGIPKKIIQKIFEPFFTTKPSGRGTGLGLSMSYEIVTKGHRGELKVASKEGEGTTFTIVLPVVKETKKSKK